MLRGNTYVLGVKFFDCSGKEVSGRRVEKAEFVIGGIDVLYDVDGENERVVYDEANNRFLIALTESDTLGFAGRSVKWQAKALLDNGEVAGTIEKEEYLYDTLCKTVLNDDGEITYESEITILQALLENVVGGGIADYDNLTDKPKINGVELQGNKTSSELGIATKTSELENDSGYITNAVDDLVNYTKTSYLGSLASKDTVDYATEVTNKPFIPSSTSDLTNNGDGTSAFATESYVETHGGKIDKIQKNGVELPISNKTVNVTVPVATSEITNDSGFIDNTVNDLANYYLKSETYTKTEVQNLLSGITTITYSIVSELPTASVDTYFNVSKTIYLLAITGSGSDYYDEYITVRSGVEGSYTYSWEKLGNTQVDLSGYVQKTFTIAGIDMQDNITKSELQSALDFNTKVDKTTTVAGVDLQDNITANELATALGLNNYVTATRSAYNCDTCYDAKIYMVANGSNCPSSDQYGTLLVMPYRKASGNAKPDYAVQMFMPNGDDATKAYSLFYRTSLENTWNDWVEVAKLSDVPTNLLNGEGTNSLKMKNNNTVSGNNSFAEGTNNTIFSDNSHAEGNSVTKATSRGITTSSTDTEIETEWLASDPEGDKFSLAKGENSHIEGINNLALGGNSHAEGNGTRAMNNSAHSEGTGTKASGKYSHAEGLETIASGGRAHSEGDSTEATADYTHAEGRGTKAYGKYAHVEGRDTQVNVNIEYSHAEGRNTIAAHAYSHVEGQGTITSRSHQHISGKYNTGDSTAYLIVGDGSADNSRSNCFSAGNDGTNKYIKIGNTKITDANAVTKAVNDLTNYYTKSETYTKTEVDNLIGGAMNINFSIVQSLPEPTSSTYFNTSKTIYMILNTNPSGNDYYNEYITIMVGYSFTWELIGTTQIDLTGYVKDVAIQHGDNNGTTVATAIIANDLSGNIASGEYCFAEGRQNIASGALGAHAEGYLNTASGAHSHTEGASNTSSGQASHTEGFYNTASGYATHAEGGRCSATFEYAHAEGQFTTANGFASHSEGCQTTTGTVARQSHTEGYFTEAHNYQSHAEGDYSIAGFNDNTVATFDISATYAENTIVKNGTGLYYLCIKATTGNALDNTTYWNLIESNHAEGKNTRSTSVASHAEGVNSIASGKASHAEGNGTYATNNASHSEGTGSQATGKYSHAEGLESVASGSRSHAEGYTTTASGDSAHAQGRDTVASGKYSFASGRGTTASKENQTALGQYNATDNEALFIVGTGSKSGDTVNARNSFAAGHDGTASFIKVGSTKFRETELAKKSDIPTSVNGLGGGTLTSPLNISGGDGASASKIAISNAQAGQITDQSTSTIFGFLSNNDTTLTVGGNSYALNLRGSGARPTYKGNALALYSDLSTDTNTWRPVKVNGVEKLTNSTSGNSLDLVAGTNVTLTESNGAVTISASGGGSSQTIETYTISSWTALSSSSPYTYQATVTATATIGANTIVELFNDQAVAFATYGFAIGSISGQSITIYSIGQPSSSITLKVKIGG